MTVMFSACRPFGPRAVSNSTFWFSSSERYPPDAIALKCAKTSAEPSSGAMKPKPLSALNHLTVPVAIFFSFCKAEPPKRLRRARPQVVQGSDGDVRRRKLVVRASRMGFAAGYETERPGVRDAAISDLREDPVRGFV